MARRGRRRGARCALLLAALTGAAAIATASAAEEQQQQIAPPPKYNCDACDLSIAPVCGVSDGQWYQNGCLAFCAGARWRDGDHAPCAARPSPFTSGKPGPWGAEADDGGPPPPVKQNVLTAFKAEGFRYLGRIRLARELDLVSRAGGASGSSALLAALTGGGAGGAPFGGVSLEAAGGHNNSSSGLGWWVPPPKDSKGNWLVDAVRCTVDGDMYAGKMLVDGNNPLTVVDAVRPLAAASGGAGAGGVGGGGLASGKAISAGGFATSAPAAASPAPAAAATAAAPQQRARRGLGPLAVSGGVKTAAAAEQAARLKVAAGSGAAAAVEEAAEALELAAQQVQEQQQKQQQAAAAASKSSSKAAAPLAGLAKALEDGKAATTGWWESLKTAFTQGVAKGRATAVAAKQQPAQQLSSGAAPATAGGRSLLSHSEDEVEQVEAEAEPSEMVDARRAAEAEAQSALTQRVSRPGGRRASAGSSSTGGIGGAGNPPPAGGRALKGIVGADERFACTPRKWPFTAIGQIEVLDDSGVYICTGTLIAPDKVITAGHCVWNSKRGAFYFNLSFSPGRYRTEDGRKVDPWGTIPWSSVTVFDQFKKDPTQWDVAVVTLAQPVGEQAGTMGLAAGCAKNARLWVSGYPQEKSEGTCMTATCLDPVLDCNAQLNAHTCDTTSGMSGAPMFDSKYRVRMLHVAGVEGKQENRATTVSDFLISTVMKW